MTASTFTPPPAPLTLHDRFMQYHAENPVVYKLFIRFAKEARAAGMTRYSAKAIMERLRWEVRISLKRDTEFKIDNNYVARYARMLAAEDPSFEEFFEFRTLKAT